MNNPILLKFGTKVQLSIFNENVEIDWEMTPQWRHNCSGGLGSFLSVLPRKSCHGSSKGPILKPLLLNEFQYIFEKSLNLIKLSFSLSELWAKNLRVVLDTPLSGQDRAKKENCLVLLQENLAETEIFELQMQTEIFFHTILLVSPFCACPMQKISSGDRRKMWEEIRLNNLFGKTHHPLSTKTPNRLKVKVTRPVTSQMTYSIKRKKIQSTHLMTKQKDFHQQKYHPYIFIQVYSKLDHKHVRTMAF